MAGDLELVGEMQPKPREKLHFCLRGRLFRPSLAEFSVSWARVSDQDYTFRLDHDANPCDSYQVFEHRYAGGWMILVNKPIRSSDVPEAEDVISLENGKSLIVTTKEHFSSYNLEHVEKARAVEVRLNELGLLPALGIPIPD
ncbi:Imm52 family immunity protein [Chromobacterium amazonense]|uniref:Imm52 family immunity protein n=1 Tax=Chromobacterium amazonense TaxID=1382803 RepID=UPI0009F3C4C1|nr:Imm52 family immunity protein [Chromobacterium amazonense]